MEARIERNEQYNSNEVYFDGKPSAEIRDALKAAGYRWHGVKGCWYGYKPVPEIVTGEQAKHHKPEQGSNPAIKPEKKNKYGVKIGDLFVMSWGLEQTNLDFFQVVELIGESSVRVKQVLPDITSEFAVSSMSRDITVKVPENGEMLTVDERGFFIHDHEKGDVHRLTSYNDDLPYFKVEGRYYACLYVGQKLYESWYA